MGKGKQPKQRRKQRRDLSDKGAAKGGLSIGAFIQAKQQDPTFRRERKRKAFIRDAKIVNKYKRLLKYEGLQPTKEATKRRSKSKTDRFFKGKMQARAENMTKAQREVEAKRRADAKKKRRKERSVETRKLQKRTKSGQPMMKYSMERLLGQIQKNHNTSNA